MSIVPADKGRDLKQRGIVICGSSVAIFAPVLLMMLRRGGNPVIYWVIGLCWAFDFVLGLWFIVRGNKLMQESGR